MPINIQERQKQVDRNDDKSKYSPEDLDVTTDSYDPSGYADDRRPVDEKLDDNYSKFIRNKPITGTQALTHLEGTASDSFTPFNGLSNYYESLFHSAGIYSPQEIRKNLYTGTFRFGYHNLYNNITQGREFLFFTKPNLNIIKQDDTTLRTVGDTTLQTYLQSLPFWTDMSLNRQNTIAALESSYSDAKYGYRDPFNHILQNQVSSNLEIPNLSADMIDTPTNAFGVNYKYRGSTESGDDNPSFSLEFNDTKWLDVYYVFKAYDEYEKLKAHGVIRPAKYYITHRIIHDAFSIFKFIVDEDMETIIYWGKMYGVVPTSLPRDLFNTPTFEQQLSFSIDFQAAWYDDMKPEILQDFNDLAKPLLTDSRLDAKYWLSTYNTNLDAVDRRIGKVAYIIKEKDVNSAYSPTGYRYKLKWKGSDLY